MSSTVAGRLASSQYAGRTTVTPRSNGVPRAPRTDQAALWGLAALGRDLAEGYDPDGHDPAGRRTRLPRHGCAGPEDHPIAHQISEARGGEHATGGGPPGAGRG